MNPAQFALAAVGWTVVACDECEGTAALVLWNRSQLFNVWFVVGGEFTCVDTWTHQNTTQLTESEVLDWARTRLAQLNADQS